jgi:hypothetical protein
MTGKFVKPVVAQWGAGGGPGAAGFWSSDSRLIDGCLALVDLAVGRPGTRDNSYRPDPGCAESALPACFIQYNSNPAPRLSPVRRKTGQRP